jgi:hypothetical protein
MQLVTSTQEEMAKRTFNLMIRFELALFPYKYRNPWYMVEAGIKEESEYTKMIIGNYLTQTGNN